MKNVIKIAVFVVVVMCVLPYTVDATSLVGNTWHPDGDYFTRQINDGAITRTRIGEFTTQVRDDDGNLMNDGEWFSALCVEPGQIAQSGGELVVQAIKPSEKNGGLQAAWLFDTYYAKDMSFDQLAGLQIAIWEVIVDDSGSYNLSQGNMKILGGDADAIAFAGGYLESVPGGFDADYLDSQYLIAEHPDKQDLIIRTPVPEPSTVLLLAAGLLGMGSMVRRKRQK
ncbi:hypothetical protein U27_02560 [Candidatus Vecturithrix granuli]|uniref:Ice-binding protein C-terminal domain-containing protein n=1 Tax=Vecturithrix granuli TaxID=1499967 RepID=A0A081CAX6_VECG1|nr:hypothetical protein U27_02560 [Candidatus Vecturithrix granuli]